jgi:hypothetical protein
VAVGYATRAHARYRQVFQAYSGDSEHGETTKERSVVLIAGAAVVRQPVVADAANLHVAGPLPPDEVAQQQRNQLDVETHIDSKRLYCHLDAVLLSPLMAHIGLRPAHRYNTINIII